jgi:hypothetical protein
MKYFAVIIVAVALVSLVLAQVDDIEEIDICGLNDFAKSR